MSVLLSTSYFGPVQYYTKLISAEKVIIERFEHFPKQTWRNRCSIYGANGPQTLSVPVTKGDVLKVYTKDIRIDYSMPWQKIHFKAIESSYRCSPFYEYYIDDLISFFEKRYDFLYDYNLDIINVVCELIGFSPIIEESDNYIVDLPANYIDYRDAIHPKPRMFKPDPSFAAPVYRQVFEPKSGFVSNLSVLDLLFNTGTEALVLLKKSYIVA
ncbi:MAG: WbqC family protein [Bacteroidota bacterium]|nr:WbqC family protein [Bacteroidota bacterium]